MRPKDSIWPATANAPGNLTERLPDPAQPTAEPMRPLLAVRRSFEFAGRSSRSELIAYLFASLLVSVPVSFVTGLVLLHNPHWMTMNALTVLLALPVPALLVRRLHDSGRSGAWVWLAVLVFAVWLTRTVISFRLGLDARRSFDSWTWLVDWLVIVANLATVLLALLPGTKGLNRFGADPRQASEG